VKVNKVQKEPPPSRRTLKVYSVLSSKPVWRAQRRPGKGSHPRSYCPPLRTRSARRQRPKRNRKMFWNKS